MNVRLIKLTKEYYHQLADMIDEIKELFYLTISNDILFKRDFK